MNRVIAITGASISTVCNWKTSIHKPEDWKAAAISAMKLRCPYCRKEFGPEPLAICPHCGKGMRVPEALQKKPFRERRKARARIDREAERKRSAMHAPFSPQPGRKPSSIFAILLVMIIVGGFLITRVTRVSQPVTRKNPACIAENELRNLRIALERFYEDCGRYPSTREGLAALIKNPGPEGWGGPYVNLIKPDPWKQPYQYTCDDSNPALFSSGPDGKSGSLDDLFPEQPTREEIRRN